MPPNSISWQYVSRISWGVSPGPPTLRESPQVAMLSTPNFLNLLPPMRCPFHHQSGYQNIEASDHSVFANFITVL